MRVLTTDMFSAWFDALDDETAEAVATAVEVVEQLGPARAAPGSSERLLWYEHADVSRIGGLAVLLESWGPLVDYVGRVLEQLESPRFVARLAQLAPTDAALVLEAVKKIRSVSGLRSRWSSAVRIVTRAREPGLCAEDVRAEVRQHYLDALRAAGLEVADVPAHSTALRELSMRTPAPITMGPQAGPNPAPASPAPGFRLLYGVDTRSETALVVLGERLDRTFYGDSVRRAESAWRAYLDGSLSDVGHAQLR